MVLCATLGGLLGELCWRCVLFVACHLAESTLAKCTVSWPLAPDQVRNDSAARLCTDNGVMVAWAGIERLRLGALDDPSDMEVRARWPLGISHTPPDSVKVGSTKHTKLTSTQAVAPAAAATTAQVLLQVLPASDAPLNCC